MARKVLIKHLQSGNSYGIQLKESHAKFPQPELGPWVKGSKTVGTNWVPSVLPGWEAPEATSPPRHPHDVLGEGLRARPESFLGR